MICVVLGTKKGYDMTLKSLKIIHFKVKVTVHTVPKFVSGLYLYNALNNGKLDKDKLINVTNFIHNRRMCLSLSSRSYL